MPVKIEEDRAWMEIAYDQAMLAAENSEVPVGAAVVLHNRLIAKAGNAPIGRKDPTAHAEILALRQAALTIDNYRLTGATLYVTLEPCIMCMGAILHARISRLVYGASDPKTGAVDSVYGIGRDGLLNHSLEVSSGVLAEESGKLLKDFFRCRR